MSSPDEFFLSILASVIPLGLVRYVRQTIWLHLSVFDSHLIVWLTDIDVRYNVSHFYWYRLPSILDENVLRTCVSHADARLKPRIHQRNMLRGNKLRGRATCCRQQTTCYGQQVACCAQHAASSNLQLRATLRETCCAGVNAALDGPVAFLSICLSVCLSVRHTYAGIVSYCHPFFTTR